MTMQAEVYVVGYVDFKTKYVYKGRVFTNEEQAIRYAEHLEGLYVNELENKQGFILSSIMDFMYDVRRR